MGDCMKVAFIIPKLSYSGAPKIMTWVANGMVKMGHEVVIIVMYKSKCEQLLDKRIKTFFLKNVQYKSWMCRNTIGMLGTVFSCRRIIKNEDPDIVVSFLDSVSYVYVALNHFFWKDIIVTSERVDPYSRGKINAKIMLSTMKKSDLVVFQTADAKAFFEKKCHTLNSCIIPNPVVIDGLVKSAIENRKKINKTKHKQFKISFVGRLSIKQKRQDVLVKAMVELKRRREDFKLYIYGSGPDKRNIEKLIHENSLEGHVALVGQKEKIPLEIFDSDCFILTSDYEGIPNALIEAMSIGIPCVSTDCSPGGAKLLIKNGKNGFLVNRGDYSAIADKTIWIKEHREESRAIGDNAMKISEEYSEKKVLGAWEKEILKIVKRKNEKR